MKSQANALLRVALGILTDASMAYAPLKGCELDKARLYLGVRSRGLGFFTLTLPELDKALLSCLATGRLTHEGAYLKRRSSRSRIPRFLSGLWMRVIDHDGCLLPEPDINAILFLRQIFCLGKKIEVDCSPARVCDTVREYADVERGLRSPSYNWEGDCLDYHSSDIHVSFTDAVDEAGLDSPDLFSDREETGEGRDTTRMIELLRNLDKICLDLAGRVGLLDLWSETPEVSRGRSSGLRHGPGAVADAKGSAFKYRFPTWTQKLQWCFPVDWFGSYDLAQHDDHSESRLDHEPPARLLSVPKTAKGPRLIASEPTAHQWAQQLLADALITRVDKIIGRKFLSIRDQVPSRNMALAASRDGSLATIDLSNASDRLSLWAMERAWRGNKPFLDYFHSCRTRWVKDCISDQPAYFFPKKFATAGSAMTFPLQTIFFWCCAMASLGATTVEEAKKKWGHKVRVFGDDIIVPVHVYADLTDLLHELGLKVNESKSFHTGLFRESCGLDAYAGYNVTPQKPKSMRSDTPTSAAALVDVSNNFHKGGLWHAAEAVRSIATEQLRKGLPVVGPGVGVAGWASFVGSSTEHLRRRWSTRFHRFEVLVLDFASKIKRKPTDDTAGLLQYFVEEPSVFLPWKHGVDGRPVHSNVRRWRDESEFIPI